MRLIVAQVCMASPVNFGSDFDLRYCVDLPANSLVGSSSDAISAFVSFAAFDGPARDAAGSVDSPSGQNGSGRTRVDAAVAVSAAVGHGRPAGVELGRRDDFAQQHERSQTGMDQERVPSDPAESGLGGPCLLDDRGRIGESASFGIRVQFAHEDEQFGELLAERQVIVARVSV